MIQQLFKYNLNGKLLISGPKLKLHHGGITYFKDKIYVAVSGCESGGSNEHFVHVYNAKSLKFIQSHKSLFHPCGIFSDCMRLKYGEHSNLHLAII